MTMKMASRLIHLINKKQIYTCCIFVSVKKVKIYSTVQKKCKRNSGFFSFFVLAKIRRNFAAKFRQSALEFSSNQTKFHCHLGKILHPLKQNFVSPKFCWSENSQLRNLHKVKFCWQWRRVVIKTFYSDRFKPLARVIN